MTPEQIKKITRLCESVEIYREIDDGTEDGKEITIEVFYSSSPAEARTHNHPGYPADVEIVLALDPDNNEVELTEKEKEQATELAFEAEEGDDAPDSCEREDFDRD